MAIDTDTRVRSLESDLSLLKGQVKRLESSLAEVERRSSSFPIDIREAKSEMKAEIYKASTRDLDYVMKWVFAVFLLALVALLGALEAIERVRELGAG